MTTRYVALLRGVNLGNTNKIKMDELRQVAAGLGFTDVQTYLQSGNVVFDAPADAAPEDLASGIEKAMSDALGMTVPVLLRSSRDFAQILAANPYLDQEDDPTKLHVTFLLEDPPADRLSDLQIPAGETGVLTISGREIYLHCPDGYGRTKLTNTFLERRLAVAATTRNWRSVVALHDLVAG